MSSSGSQLEKPHVDIRVATHINFLYAGAARHQFDATVASLEAREKLAKNFGSSYQFDKVPLKKTLDTYLQDTESASKYIFAHQRIVYNLRANKPYLTFVQSVLNAALLRAAQCYFEKKPDVKTFNKKFGKLFKINDNMVVYIVPDKEALTKPRVIQDLLHNCKSRIHNVSDSQTIILHELQAALKEIQSTNAPLPAYMIDTPFTVSNNTFQFSANFSELVMVMTRLQNQYHESLKEADLLDLFEEETAKYMKDLETTENEQIANIYKETEAALQAKANAIYDIYLYSKISEKKLVLANEKFQELRKYCNEHKELLSNSTLKEDSDHITKMKLLRDIAKRQVKIIKLRFIKQTVEDIIKSFPVIDPHAIAIKKYLELDDTAKLTEQSLKLNAEISFLSENIKSIQEFQLQFNKLMTNNEDNPDFIKFSTAFNDVLTAANMNQLFVQFKLHAEYLQQAINLIAQSQAISKLTAEFEKTKSALTLRISDLKQESADAAYHCARFKEGKEKKFNNQDSFGKALAAKESLDKLKKEFEFLEHSFEQYQQTYLQLKTQVSSNKITSPLLKDYDVKIQNEMKTLDDLQQQIASMKVTISQQQEKNTNVCNDIDKFFQQWTKRHQTILHFINELITSPQHKAFWQLQTSHANLSHLFVNELWHKGQVREVRYYPNTIIKIANLIRAADISSEEKCLVLLIDKIRPLLQESIDNHAEELKGPVENIKPLRLFYLGIISLLNLTNEQPNPPDVPQTLDGLLKLGKDYLALPKRISPSASFSNGVK